MITKRHKTTGKRCKITTNNYKKKEINRRRDKTTAKRREPTMKRCKMNKHKERQRHRKQL